MNAVTYNICDEEIVDIYDVEIICIALCANETSDLVREIIKMHFYFYDDYLSKKRLRSSHSIQDEYQY